LEFEPPDDTLPPTKDIVKIMNPETLLIQSRLCLHLLQRGIAAFDRGFFVFSAAHTREDIDQTVQALADSLDAMVAEGTLGKEFMTG
jgi:glutamate-1-semialdehyde aminotransferase